MCLLNGEILSSRLVLFDSSVETVRILHDMRWLWHSLSCWLSTSCWAVLVLCGDCKQKRQAVGSKVSFAMFNVMAGLRDSIQPRSSNSARQETIVTIVYSSD